MNPNDYTPPRYFEAPQEGPQPPAEAPKTKRRWVAPVAALAALLVGVGIGAAGASAEPEIVTEEVEVIKEVEVEVPGPERVVEVSVLPASCEQALAEADSIMLAAGEGFGLFADFAGYSSEAVMAAASMDVAEIERLTPLIQGVNTDLNGLASQVDGSMYRTYADACLSTVN